MNRLIALLTIIIIGIGISVSATQYAVYYASTEQQDTALILMNSGGNETYYTLKIYDAYGSLLDAVSGDLAPFESDYHVVSDIVGNAATYWGLALVETPGIMTIGLETFVDKGWQASENVTDAVMTDVTAKYYWYGLNYANTSDQATGVVAVNPFDTPVAGKFFVYDASGNQVHSEDFLLDPHESTYFALRKLLTTADSMWGAIDIKATAPIVVAGEYFAANGTLLNVDEITRFYFYEEFQ